MGDYGDDAGDTWSDLSAEMAEPESPTADTHNDVGGAVQIEMTTAPPPVVTTTPPPVSHVAAIMPWWASRILEGPLKHRRASLGPQHRPIRSAACCSGLWSEGPATEVLNHVTVARLTTFRVGTKLSQLIL